MNSTLVSYSFTIKVGGKYFPGFNPVWRAFKRYGSTESLLDHSPPVSDLGDGYYNVSWDLAKGKQVMGDMISASGHIADHPLEFFITRESAVILSLDQTADMTSPDQPQ